MLHIDLPTRSEIDKLVALRRFPAVSIYLPSSPVTPDTRVARIALGNLVKTAVARMEAAAAPRHNISTIRESIETLIEDDEFWAEQASSLAIFAAPDAIRTFRLPNNLGELIEVSDRFYLKPLLRSVSFPHNAYVLAIGIGAVRLIAISADLPPEEVSLPSLPRDFNQALGRRSHLAHDGDMRSGESASEHALLTRYARVVDRALRPTLAGDERPLIVAAAEPMASIFRSVSSYPHIARQVISGSADHTPVHELATAARQMLDLVYADEIRELGELYSTRETEGRATADIAQAARAATFGAVDTLVVDMDAVIPGTVAEADGAVTFASSSSAANYGVVDEIARRALQSGARVIAARRTDVPGGGALAAILRYPV